ncbi:hypothetical protein FSARC_11408 [Fusarium sarcochroum]|uniref:Steroid 5-alpha reductase C-terminal domain-containing protein n=1 Tax=Fusarium sarcochroum TaxID=1208366 RepID=A0A8H4X099_9HYPO|nr:hypothetical protein FSARC_11408 [Fusarium sarcochroum]
MTGELHDNVSRTKRFNAPGVITFVGLRSADVLLQYYLIRHGLGTKLIEALGGRAVDANQVIASSNIGLRPYYSIIAAMALGSSVKQILTMLIVSEQDTPVSSAVVISFFNTAFNTINSFFSLWATTTNVPTTLASGQSSAVFVGLGFYLFGILAEIVSELQRTAFKRNPDNKGKPFSGGLFSMARHINYGGYTIWRAAYAFTAGGWAWGLVVGSFFFYDFASRGVPVLDAYMSKRYGVEWVSIKAKVPYRLIPGVY